MNIDEFILNEVNKPFVWGETDCCSTCDRWVESQIGFSPLKNSQQVFKSEEEAKRLIKRSQNIFKAAYKVMKKANFLVTKNPVMGDVAIIPLSPTIVCLAIHAGDYWFSRNEKGIIGASINGIVLKAWSIKCPQQ